MSIEVRRALKGGLGADNGKELGQYVEQTRGTWESPVEVIRGVGYACWIF